MGYDNHFIRGYDRYDRLHSKNNMKFNLLVASIADTKYKIDDYKENTKFDIMKNSCFFRDCGDAEKVGLYLSYEHGCIDGIHVFKSDAHAAIRENIGDD